MTEKRHYIWKLTILWNNIKIRLNYFSAFFIRRKVFRQFYEFVLSLRTCLEFQLLIILMGLFSFFLNFNWFFWIFIFIFDRLAFISMDHWAQFYFNHVFFCILPRCDDEKQNLWEMLGRFTSLNTYCVLFDISKWLICIILWKCWKIRNSLIIINKNKKGHWQLFK